MVYCIWYFYKKMFFSESERKLMCLRHVNVSRNMDVNRVFRNYSTGVHFLIISSKHTSRYFLTSLERSSSLIFLCEYIGIECNFVDQRRRSKNVFRWSAVRIFWKIDFSRLSAGKSFEESAYGTWAAAVCLNLERFAICALQHSRYQRPPSDLTTLSAIFTLYV